MTAERGRVLIDSPEAFQTAFSVSRETIERLRTYEALLRQWQKAVQLVAPSTLDAVWHRHFADSAQLLNFAPPNAGKWVDVGSGGGFPGLVLAIMLVEGSPGRMTLIESDSRKAAFLAEVARRTGVAVDILSTRTEIASTYTKVGHADVITARALAPLTRLLDLVRPYWSPSTVGLFLKGRGCEREASEARQHWRFSLELRPNLIEPEGHVAIVRGFSARTEE